MQCSLLPTLKEGATVTQHAGLNNWLKERFIVSVCIENNFKNQKAHAQLVLNQSLGGKRLELQKTTFQGL